MQNKPQKTGGKRKSQTENAFLNRRWHYVVFGAFGILSRFCIQNKATASTKYEIAQKYYPVCVWKYGKKNYHIN